MKHIGMVTGSNQIRLQFYPCFIIDRSPLQLPASFDLGQIRSVPGQTVEQHHRLACAFSRYMLYQPVEACLERFIAVGEYFLIVLLRFTVHLSN
ncbi:hypothetical protein D3C81_1882650 [compost metagenome]